MRCKSDGCLARRGFDFEYATRLFDEPVHERQDVRFAYGEARTQAIGHIEGRLFVVVYTMRDGATRIISARPAHREEWDSWPK